jgi:hypothetical protein
MVKD